MTTTLTPSLTVVNLPGGPSSLDVTVIRTADSTGADGATVTFATDFGTLSGTTCTTNASGQCSVTLSSTDPGVAHVTADVADGTGSHSDAKTVTFHGPWNITLTGGVAHTARRGRGRRQRHGRHRRRQPLGCEPPP